MAYRQVDKSGYGHGGDQIDESVRGDYDAHD